MTPRQFTASIESALTPLADSAKAGPMAAYMKDHFAFLGIKSPERRAATRGLIRDQREGVVESAEALWALPYREYQYAACDLLERHGKALPASALPRVLKLVTAKSWWDTVDALAKVVGTMARNERKLVPRVEKLATHEDMWLRRIAILHQLGYGAITDVERLTRICLANAADPEFFIRKAIGWALREHAHHDPNFVRRFLKRHGAEFSPLTVREAGKHL